MPKVAKLFNPHRILFDPHRIVPCCSPQRVHEQQTWGSGNFYGKVRCVFHNHYHDDDDDDEYDDKDVDDDDDDDAP